jgi:hypothetical protein
MTVTSGAVASVGVSPTTGIIAPNTTYQLNAIVLPADAPDLSVTWTSLDPSIATVDTSGLVSGVATGTAQIVVTTVDGGFTATNTTFVSDGFGGTSFTIEAEDFDSTGGTAQNTIDNPVTYGVKIYTIGSITGINWVQGGDWAEYSVDVPESGVYKIEYQIGTPLDGSTVAFRLNGTTSVAVDNVPNSGSWNVFPVLQSGKVVTLAAGTNTIRLVAGSNAWQWNMDKFILTRIDDDSFVLPTVGAILDLSIVDGGFVITATNGTAHGYFSLLSKTDLSDTNDWTVMLTNLTFGAVGDAIISNTMDGANQHFFRIKEGEIPAVDPPVSNLTLEAEAFDHTGGAYDGVNIYTTPGDVDAINWVQLGDWIEFDNINLVPGLYRIEYFTGTVAGTDPAVDLLIDESTVAHDALPINGDWDTFVSTVSATQVTVSAGPHTIRVLANGTGEWQFNMDRLILTRVGDLP